MLAWQDIVLYDEDVALLEDGQWLNDKIIEWVYQWMEVKCGGSQTNILFLRPLMVTMLSQSTGPVTDLAGVLPPRLDERDVIWMPVNDGSGLEGGSGSHWSVLLYHAGTASFYHFDSYHNANKRHARHAAKRITPLLRQHMQKLAFVDVPVGPQGNGSDCGVYVCAVTRHLSETYFLPAVDGRGSTAATASATAAGQTSPGSHSTSAATVTLRSPDVIEKCVHDPFLTSWTPADMAAERRRMRDLIAELAASASARH